MLLTAICGRCCCCCCFCYCCNIITVINIVAIIIINCFINITITVVIIIVVIVGSAVKNSYDYQLWTIETIVPADDKVVIVVVVYI